MAADFLFVCSILYCKILVLTFSFTSLKLRTNNPNGSVLSCAAKWDRKLYPQRNTGLARRSKLKGISVDIWTTSMLTDLSKNALLAMSFVFLYYSLETLVQILHQLMFLKLQVLEMAYRSDNGKPKVKKLKQSLKRLHLCLAHRTTEVVQRLFLQKHS